MAILDGINLNGTIYDIVGYNTADISYEADDNSLVINTKPLPDNPVALAADGEIDNINLNGVSHKLASSGDFKIAEVSLGNVTFNPSGATTYTPYKTVAIPSNRIISVTPLAPTALYPFAITIYPEGNNTRMVGAAFGTHGDTMPNTQEVFARIVYTDTAMAVEPI